MTQPTTRQQLIDYCLRALGHPVTVINVDPDQLEDRIDDALQFFQEYHFDATEKIYMKHYVSQTDIDNQYIDLTQTSGIVSANAGTTEIIGTNTNFLNEFIAGTSVISINGDSRLVTSVSNNTNMSVNAAFANTSTGVAIQNLTNPSSITGITRIFPLSSTSARVNMFDLRYQLRLHELYDFTSVSYVNYVLTQQHMRTLEMLFSGETPLRFQRHQNRLFIDLKWGETLQAGEYLIIEGYKILDPNQWSLVYGDRILKKYATAIIKKQWGQNLIKFSGTALLGGITLNGQKIIDDATLEIENLEAEMQLKFEEPPIFFTG